MCVTSICNICQYLQIYQDTSEKFRQRLLFRQQRGFPSRELSSDTADLVRLSTTNCPFSSISVKKCCVITKPSGWSERTRVANWKVITKVREEPRDSSGKEALNRQIQNAAYVQCVEIKHLQAALCPTGYRASAVASKLHGRLSISGNTKPVKNGSMKPSGSSEGERSDV